MPQQYSTVPGPTERDAPAESAPAGVKEGQRRSGGGNAHGGSQQIGARIAYNEFDLVLFFNDPSNESMAGDVAYISRLCDQNNIPFASNIATAEVLVLGLARGDLAWRDIVNPKTKPFTA